MNIVELYRQVPAERHSDIKVVGNRVYVRQPDGTVEEYLDSDGELWLLRKDSPQS